MDREQEEIVLRLTAHYIEAVQAGHQPKISDYLARYPQYAGAIASFIAYYQTIESPRSQPDESADNTGSAENTPRLHSADEFAGEFHIAIESAWQRVLMPENAPEGGNIQSLFLAAKQRQLTSSQFAAHLAISADILLLLEQRALLPESIPQELYRRLAETLHRPQRDVRAYLGLQPRRRVAEHPAKYDKGNVGSAGDTTQSTQKVSFREVIDTSEKLSAARKKFWRNVLTEEDL